MSGPSRTAFSCARRFARLSASIGNGTMTRTFGIGWGSFSSVGGWRARTGAARTGTTGDGRAAARLPARLLQQEPGQVVGRKARVAVILKPVVAQPQGGERSADHTSEHQPI